MSLVVRIDGERVEHAGLQGSSIRRGGYEACSFRIPVGKVPRKGADVRVWDGLSTVWHGFVKDAGVLQTRGQVRGANVTAIGYGARNKGNPFSMIFMDRSTSKWRGPSNARRATLMSSNFTPFDPVPIDDSADPGLAAQFEGAWGATGQPMVEAWYDAGPGNAIAKLRGTWTRGLSVLSGDANWAVDYGLNNVDTSIGTGDITSDQFAAGPVTFEHPATTLDRRYGALRFWYTGAAGTAGLRYNINWTDLQVIGTHGLSLITVSGMDGFYARAILEYAVNRSGFTFDIVNLGGVGANYVVPHAVYDSPVDPEVIIEDMIKLLGWNYGTWEPELFSDIPRFMYGAPPTGVTCYVNYHDLADPDINDDLLEQHNKIIATSVDAHGKTFITTLEKDHPGVPDDFVNTIVLNLGLTDTADEQASFLLALDQDTSRASGSTELPRTVQRLGGEVASHLLKPGQERIQINGFPQADNYISDSNASRGDTFSINRLTFAEDEQGAIRTNIEIDSGASLTETLTARIELAQELAGVGG